MSSVFKTSPVARSRTGDRAMLSLSKQVDGCTQAKWHLRAGRGPRGTDRGGERRPDCQPKRRGRRRRLGNSTGFDCFDGGVATNHLGRSSAAETTSFDHGSNAAAPPTGLGPQHEPESRTVQAYADPRGERNVIPDSRTWGHFRPISGFSSSHVGLRPAGRAGHRSSAR